MAWLVPNAPLLLLLLLLLLVVGCWLLVVGCWLFVLGGWWLVVGCFLLFVICYCLWLVVVVVVAFQDENAHQWDASLDGPTDACLHDHGLASGLSTQRLLLNMLFAIRCWRSWISQEESFKQKHWYLSCFQHVARSICFMNAPKNKHQKATRKCPKYTFTALPPEEKFETTFELVAVSTVRSWSPPASSHLPL